jgi:hypothetical protein
MQIPTAGFVGHGRTWSVWGRLTTTKTESHKWKRLTAARDEGRAARNVSISYGRGDSLLASGRTMERWPLIPFPLWEDGLDSWWLGPGPRQAD